MKKLLALLLGITMVFSFSLLTGCGSGSGDAEESQSDSDPAAECAALIDAIYVQDYTDDTYAQCEAAKAAWDALTDEQKEQVEGEEASPDYFGRDTGDASQDDPLNQDDIGENELLVVSFGTSFNDSRAKDIGGIEKALQEANPDWSVRRALTAQIIINHVYARDGEKIDNVEQALQKFETVKVAEPLLGTVGEDAAVVNADKEAAAQAVVAEAVNVSDYDSLDAAAADGTAFVFLGHGTSHDAAVTYDQMQEQMKLLGYKNVFVGTVEGKPEDTAFPAVKKALEDAGYTKVVLRPLMVVAGDHANNDMAGDEEGSWYYGMVNGGNFEVEGSDEAVDTGAGLGAENVSCQIEGLGRIADIQKIYIQHTADAMAAQ